MLFIISFLCEIWSDLRMVYCLHAFSSSKQTFRVFCLEPSTCGDILYMHCSAQQWTLMGCQSFGCGVVMEQNVTIVSNRHLLDSYKCEWQRWNWPQSENMNSLVSTPQQSHSLVPFSEEDSRKLLNGFSIMSFNKRSSFNGIKFWLINFIRLQ